MSRFFKREDDVSKHSAARTPEPPVAAPPARRVPSEEPNPIARAMAGETVVVSLPESEQPHPVYGLDVPPDAPDAGVQERDTQE